MATQVDIAKIKVRRGLDSERLQVVLDSGELGFTTDTQRLFVGDGTTLGGIPVSTRFAGTYSSVNDITSIGLGDTVIINNIAYIYIGGNINNINSYFTSAAQGVDDVTIGVNGSNQLYVKSITSFLPGIVDTTQGLKVTASNKIATKVDGSSLNYNGSGEIQVNTITGAQHGNQTSGSLHAVATTTVAGFMSAADKVKLNNSPDWSLNPLANAVVAQIIDSINSYTSGTITNVTGADSVDVKVGNNTTSQVTGNYLLNQANSYNGAVQPGTILTSSINSTKISNVGQLPLWQFNTSSFNLANRGFILLGGDGIQYGFYYDDGSFTPSDNATWISVNKNESASLMQSISAAESSGTYAYRLFDVYTDTSTNFYVKGLYPNYGAYYNNIFGSTNITITQLVDGQQSAALTNKLICGTAASATIPVAGLPTKNTIVLDGTITGAGLDAGTTNSNKYLTVYNSDYVKHVFYFYNAATPTSPPSVNNNTYYPGTVTQIHQVTYTSADNNATLRSALETALNTAGFTVTSTASNTIQFETSNSGYSLDIYTNYGSSVITSVTLGGDYLASQTSGNGVPNTSSLTQVCSDIITSVGSPGIANIKLPGVPAITYATEAGTRNSVALIKY